MGTIALRKQGKRSYYVYQESYRQKLNPDDAGKGRGSGQSRVRTRAIYLGSAEKILHCVQQTPQPLEVTVRHFGLIAAAYQTAQRLGLPQLLEQHLPGSRGGVARWVYFFVTVINRLDQATSKNKMSGWLKKTILPQLLGFDAEQLTSKNFWYAADDILSEREVRERREKEPDEEDLFVGIDESVFTTIEAQLFQRIDQLIGLKQLCGEVDLTLVLDKGNNKKETFNALYGHVSWIGSLPQSYDQALMERPLSDYHGMWKGRHYYRCEQQVMGMPCVIIVLFNPATKRKQEHSLRRGIEKLKQALNQKWHSYKRVPKKMTQGVQSIKNKSRYGGYLTVSVNDGQLEFSENEDLINQKKRSFGKSLLFSNLKSAETGYLIDAYTGKNIIEDDFRLLKDVTLIRFRPIRHWTDTKIRAYAFCCVLAMTLIRVMQWRVEQAEYKMTPTLLKDELTDLQEVVMVYSSGQAERRISQRSTVQDKLWDIFQLGHIEQQLLLH